MALAPLGQCPPGLGQEEMELGLAPLVAVYTAMVRVVNRHVRYGATAVFLIESRVAESGTIVDTTTPRAVHHYFFP